MLASQTQINPAYQGQFQGQPNGVYNAAQNPGVAPQGFDFSSIINTVAQGAAQALPGLLMGLLSSDPQIQQQIAQQGGQQAGALNPQSLFNFGVKTPFGGAGLSMFDSAPQLGGQQYGAQQYGYGAQQQGGVAPQGFDFDGLLRTVAQGAAQALPGLLMGLLSSNPQIQQIARQGGQQAGGVNPQGLFNFGVNTPFGGAGLSMFDSAPQLGAQQQYGGVNPQGFNFGNILKSVAQRAAQALPGLLTHLLSADPQIQQLARQSGQQIGGVNPQGLFNFGVNTPFGGAGLSIFDSAPQIGAQQYGGVNPQGFNFGNILKSVAQRAAQALPGLLTQLLSADPQIQQIARQSGQQIGGVNPQGLFNFGVNTPFGGAGLSIFDSAPQLGGQGQQWAGQQGGQQWGGVNPQGIDLRGLAQNLAGILAPQIPAIVSAILGQVTGNQQGTQVTVH